jgi:RNA polymerase sigma-70 factor (ECF subfamily)
MTPASAWRRLRYGVFAAVLSHHPERDPAQGPGSVPAVEHVAFIDLFARYHLSLLDYLYGMTRDRELADDLAQDTFMHAWAAAPDLVGIAQPRAWLYRIATHLALDAIRHRSHFAWLPLSLIEPESGGTAMEAWSALPPIQLPQSHGDLAGGVVERDAIWTVLTELPARWRAVLLLQTVAGFEVREIAALLRLSEANVRKVLFRAKERFRMLYRRLDGEGGMG